MRDTSAVLVDQSSTCDADPENRPRQGALTDHASMEQIAVQAAHGCLGCQAVLLWR